MSSRHTNVCIIGGCRHEQHHSISKEHPRAADADHKESATGGGLQFMPDD